MKEKKQRNMSRGGVLYTRKVKAFTLIELLAVIVILAIIAVIATPIILGVINDSKYKAFKLSLNNIEHAYELYATQNNIEPGTEIDIEDLPLDSKNLKGKVFLNSEGKVELKEVTDGTYSAEGTLDDLSMLKGTIEDLLANRLDVDIKLTSTSSSIVVNVETKEGYPTSYSYQITGPDDDKKEVNNLKESTYTFDKLNLNTEYSIKVIVKNKAGLTKEITKTIKTELVLEPELGNLIPVVYKNNNWVVVDTAKDKWYDYANQEWANAVILNDGINKIAGQELNLETDVRAMFVWIPRYEYKIEGPYGKGGVSLESPGEIEINFISKETVYSGANSSGYRVHPAFKFGTEELSGIWVGKFETSHITLSASRDANNLGCSDKNCTNADGLRILPNMESLRYNNISNFFYAVQTMDNKLNLSGDLHMMKNSEWGAVAYLSQSKYGKYGNPHYQGANKEIYQNKSSEYITGNSNGTSSQTDAIDTQYTYDVELLGTGASTTGNITGIYDMSGGAWERVMNYYEPAYNTTPDLKLPWGSTSTTNYAGFTQKIDSKYYDSYTSTDISTACSKGICYGHALSETPEWYGDCNIFASLTQPWVVRGGVNYTDALAGIFASISNYGDPRHNISLRVVLAQTT